MTALRPASSLLACLLLTACAQSPPGTTTESSSLVQLTSTEGALNARFIEIERTPEASVVQVQFIAGPSVAAALFTLRGVCAVIRARGERHGQSDPVVGQPGRYRLSFPRNPTPDQLHGPGKRVFSQDDCALMRY